MSDLVLRVFMIVLVSIEVAIGTHCLTWTRTDRGMRCTSPRATPRLELVDGWHPISFGMMTCSRGDCD